MRRWMFLQIRECALESNQRATLDDRAATQHALYTLADEPRVTISVVVPNVAGKQSSAEQS
jgi:hypothetical protein